MLIPHAAYLENDTIRREVDRLFRPGFEFVGLVQELPNDRDFLTVEYCDTSIVVQNFRGSLRAFQNICTHRFNKIQSEESGNRPLLCAYHGWRFDQEGCPIGVASRVNEMKHEDMCLTRYRLETCGQFIFITRHENQTSLHEFLGSYYSVLEEISAGMGEICYRGTIPHRANWKLLVENVIDNSHCPILHQETFVAFGFCRRPVEDTVIDGRHSSWHVPRVEIDRESVRRRALSHLDARAYRHNSFFHLHIFPNLFVASTEGASFYIGHALPIEPDETLLRVRYLAPKVEMDDRARMKQAVLNDQAVRSGLRIIDEDRPILERIQRNIGLTNKPGALLRNEPRIAAFAQAYNSAMA